MTSIENLPRSYHFRGTLEIDRLLDARPGTETPLSVPCTRTQSRRFKSGARNHLQANRPLGFRFEIRSRQSRPRVHRMSQHLCAHCPFDHTRTHRPLTFPVHSVCSPRSSMPLGRPASESGQLCHGEGDHGGGSRPRSVLMFPTRYALFPTRPAQEADGDCAGAQENNRTWFRDRRE
jgi:hypothetical protein